MQGKSAWVDSACAGCAGFLVPDAVRSPAPSFMEEPQIVPELAFASSHLRGNYWICCLQLPYHPCNTGTHSTCFFAPRGGADTDFGCANAQPSLCGELGPFQAILGNLLGSSEAISGNVRQFRVILGNFRGQDPRNEKPL